ncbi:MAG: DUF4358 domain-containing protein [Bacilli bacterium]
MKKTRKVFSLVMMLFLVMVITGCGNKNLDLKKIEKNVEELTGDKIDVPTAYSQIDNKFTYFAEMPDIYDLDKLGLKNEYLKNYIIKVTDKKEFVIVLKPVKGKKDTVEKAVNKYIKSLSLDSKFTKEEKDGVLIYLNTKNNKDILNIIYKAKSPVFSKLIPTNDEMLKNNFLIKKGMVDEYLIQTPMVIVSSNMYAIIKPSKGNEEKVKEAMDNYFAKLEEQWKTYLVDQYELVTNRKETKVGKYLVYIISNDNDKVLNEIKKNTK